MKRWLSLLLVLAACGRAPRDSRPPRSTPTVAALPRLAPDASLPASIDASAELVVAGDPPEPTAPTLPCRFDRKVFCVSDQPVLSAIGPPPFQTCARTQPGKGFSIADPKVQGRFSARETRQARQTTRDTCCYVEFDATLCR